MFKHMEIQKPNFTLWNATHMHGSKEGKSLAGSNALTSMCCSGMPRNIMLSDLQLRSDSQRFGKGFEDTGFHALADLGY